MNIYFILYHNVVYQYLDCDIEVLLLCVIVTIIDVVGIVSDIFMLFAVIYTSYIFYFFVYFKGISVSIEIRTHHVENLSPIPQG